MKITIDASPLLLRSAGVKGYIYHWIRALEAIRGSHSISLFPLIKSFGALNHEHSLAGSMTTLLGWLTLHASRGMQLLDLLGADVFHATILTTRPPRKCLLTATVHDLTCWRLPHVHTAQNVAADRLFGERVLRRAHGLIAVSESTRRDLIEILGIRPERVVAIHSGVAPEFFETQDTAAIRKAYGLEKPYVLHVGTIEPRKNLDRLLDAWLALPSDYRREWDLVFAGPQGWSSDATTARIKAQAVYLGYVPEKDMPSLTRGAGLVAYPSLYEGFGFPIAQAMAAGVPVLTSDNSSLPEVAGGGGMYIDPLDITGMSKALRTLLDSPDCRAKLGAAGSLKAQEYRWEACARKSLKFFESLPLG
ncbi:MAG: glycosyltransferase family 4 protein [Bryobacterales bacterium]|nr:glycosyltransferase family 4 protein [Bryobacterales bacterium]